MYILAFSIFWKKTINEYSKLEICYVCREFVAFTYVFIVFLETNQMIIYFCKILKACF